MEAYQGERASHAWKESWQWVGLLYLGLVRQNYNYGKIVWWDDNYFGWGNYGKEQK